eukprot:1993669-Rhodomonas_salina.2
MRMGACSEVHVRAEVGGVQLVRAPDRSLHSPAVVQPEPQLHSEPGQPLLQIRAEEQAVELPRARELDDDADVGAQRRVCHF